LSTEQKIKFILCNKHKINYKKNGNTKKEGTYPSYSVGPPPHHEYGGATTIGGGKWGVDYLFYK